MKKMHQALALATLLCQTSFSQNCNLKLHEGSKIILTAYSWTDPYVYDPKFPGMKDEKKEKLLSTYNSDVLSGKIAPASTYPMTYSVKQKTYTDGGMELTLTTNIAGKDYSSYAVCKSDTMYVYRNRGMTELTDGKGGSLGFTIQNPQKLPLNIKVGDKLPQYEDISVLYPSTTETRAKYVESNSDGSFYLYSLKATETLSFSSQMVHYVQAEVKNEEKITVGDKEHTAFVIESQTWNKGQMSISIQTAYSNLNDAYKTAMQNMQDKTDKMMLKKGYVNDAGYSVSYLKEWYVPGLGVVKSETYDNLGGIAGGMLITGID